MARTGARAAASAARLCPTCGEQVVPDAGYCTECGSPMEIGGVAPQTEPAPVETSTPAGPTTALRCAVCSEDLPADEEWCPSCGAPRAAAAPPPQATTTPESASLAPAQAPTIGSACPNCGAQLRPGARFCRSCGERFTAVAAGAPARPQTGLSQLSVGQVLAGRYRIVGVVGGGGMGAVFKGVDGNLKTRQQPEGRPVAVKAILNTGDSELLAAAVEEREMLIRLDHPNIVRIYDIVHDAGIPYIVMAYVEGTSWKEMYDSNGGPLPESEAIRLLLGIRGAFEYIHGRQPQVVYRDFKPGNAIEVKDSSGEARQVLIDLGTATEYVPGQAKEAWGTVGFAPPEVGGMSEQGPGMDLYTIASTLAALLGVDVERQPVGAPPRETWGVSPELYDFVARGRHSEPSMRFGSAKELFDQLEGISRFVGPSVPAATGAAIGDGHITRPLARTTGSLQAVVPVQSTLFTGRLSGGNSAKIGLLPTPDPADPAAPLLLAARELLSAGRHDEALVQAEAAQRANPRSVDARVMMAAALLGAGRREEAAAALEGLRSGASGAGASSRWRGLLVEAQAAEAGGDLEGALGLYGELTTLVPGEVAPKQALAGIHARLGRWPEAAQLYARVVGADPANAEAVLGWADSLMALGRSDDAIGVLDAVGEQAVRYVDAQLRLVELYVARVSARQNAGDIDGAVEDLKASARAIANLRLRSEGARFLRLEDDWWFAAYGLARSGHLKRSAADIVWPDAQQHEPTPAELARECRKACRRYLAHAPDAPDEEEILARIYIDIREWQ